MDGWQSFVIGILASILSGTLIFLNDYVKGLIGKRGFTKGNVETYSEKLTRLTGSLTHASSEVDKLLVELAQVSLERATAVQKLEEELKGLAEREEQTKKRIQDLENVPLAVAEHFAKLTEPGEKRGARRDYMLFVSGLIAGQLLSIVLKVFGY